MEYKRLHVAIAAMVSVCAFISLFVGCKNADALHANGKYLPHPRQVYRSQKFWQGIHKEKVTVPALGFLPSDSPNKVAYKKSSILNGLLIIRRDFSLDLAKRTATSRDAELDASVKHIVDRVTGRGADALRRAYEFVSKYEYDYENVYPKGDWHVWSEYYAKQMYKEGKGNCYRYASLMCWIARELGYEARTVSGEVLQSSSFGYQAHGWCEVKQGGSWYIIDPDSHKFIRDRNFYMVTMDNAPVMYRYLQKNDTAHKQ